MSLIVNSLSAMMNIPGLSCKVVRYPDIRVSSMSDNESTYSGNT